MAATHARLPWQPPERVPAGAEPEPELAPWLAEQLHQRRIVFVHGHLTAGSAGTAAATLLSLDGPDGEPVQLHLATPDGDLDAVFTLVDTIDSLQVPVHAVATSGVGGAAVGVYAVAKHRLALPHARFRLAEPKVAGIAGTADDVASAAGHHLRALEDLLVRVAEATGQPRSRVETDFSDRRLLDAVQARDYGLVHEIRQ
ncbi:MAG: ATP-dependent Clp protease proteolytic subunit [Micromonosporaceae bacterium]|nr:ATP-dependent Clp protease proteolytic subunit [Micromonosporaceae bacterium]